MVFLRVNAATIVDKGVVPEDHVVLAQHSSKSRARYASVEWTGGGQALPITTIINSRCKAYNAL
jgi:hypothetical protein